MGGGVEEQNRRRGGAILTTNELVFTFGGSYVCANCVTDSVVRHSFIGLTICAKMIDGGRPLLPELLGQTDRDGAKSPIFGLFSPVAHQP